MCWDGSPRRQLDALRLELAPELSGAVREALDLQVVHDNGKHLGSAQSREHGRAARSAGEACCGWPYGPCEEAREERTDSA